MIEASVTFVYELARIKDLQAAVKEVESSVGIIIIMCCDSSKGGHVTPSRMMLSSVEML